MTNKNIELYANKNDKISKITYLTENNELNIEFKSIKDISNFTNNLQMTNFTKIGYYFIEQKWEISAGTWSRSNSSNNLSFKASKNSYESFEQPCELLKKYLKNTSEISKGINVLKSKLQEINRLQTPEPKTPIRIGNYTIN